MATCSTAGYQRRAVQSGCGVQPDHIAPILLVAEDAPDEGGSFASVSNQAFPNGSVISTACIQESLGALEAYPVDIAVVDLHLPDGSGIEVLEECAHCDPSILCIVTTTYDDDEHLLSALVAGASGYLLKDQPETVLVQQLRLFTEGILPLSPSIGRRLMEWFTEERDAAIKTAAINDAEAQDNLVPLSGRETQVLCLIAKGFQIAEVAQLLEISGNTVSSHVKNIYRKRQVSSRAEAALEAQRLGLV